MKENNSRAANSSVGHVLYGYAMWGMVTFLALVYMLPLHAFAAPAISVGVTAANVVAGTNDQTDVTSPTQANVVGVKATTTLTVVTLPVNTNTITIGSCVVTFTTTAGSTLDETNCVDNLATIDTNLTGADTNRTTAEIATALRTLTNATSTGHGTLAITGTTSTNVIFTTSGVEASATTIGFTDGTSGKITLTQQTAGVVQAVQINTITIAGTVDTGDVFTATLPSVGAVTYTVLSSDTTTSNIAAGLNAAIHASAGYGAQIFTTAASTNTVVLTANTAGAGFTQTSGTTNRAAVTQIITFTPTDVENGYEFIVAINGVDYNSENVTTAQAVVEELATKINAGASGLTCTENDVVLTCTASIAGSGFTYDSGVHTESSSHGGGGGGGGGSSSNHTTPTAKPATPAVPGTSPAAPSANAKGFWLAHGLGFGASGDDVAALQTKLTLEGVYTGPITGYFGPLTMQGVKDYQAKHGIDQVGVVGPVTLASLNGSVTVATTPTPSTEEAKQKAVAGITAQINSLLEKVKLLQAQISAGASVQ